MGLESYNFLMFPQGNSVKLGDVGWEIIGEKYVSFSKVKEILFSKNYIKQYLPKNVTVNNDCYYCYNDGISIIEFELNCGDFEKDIQEISCRFAVCNPKGTYEKAIVLIRDLSKELNFCVLDMKLSEILDFDDKSVIRRSKKMFENKKIDFFNFLHIPYESISEPMHCGKDVFERIRQGNN